MAFKFKLVEDLDPRFEKAKSDYRHYADIDNDIVITNENLNEWALNEAAIKNGMRKFDLKDMLLKEQITKCEDCGDDLHDNDDDDDKDESEVEVLEEDVTIDQAAREADAEVEVAEGKGQIHTALDKALKRARRVQGQKGADFPNIILVGDAGSGKSAQVRQWAKENNINLVYKDIKTITPTDLGGLKMRDLDDPDYAKRVGSKEFIQALSKPNSVLFLDEYNRAKTEVRGTLLTLVNEHVVWDPKAEGEEAFLPNFLFTIMAINPATGAYPGARDLDPAERSRARRVNVQMIPEEHLSYLKKVYTKEIEEAEDPQDKLECEGRLAIAEKILTDKTFYYDTPDEVIDLHDDPSWVPLNYRSFKKLLDETDGTKKDFLDNWNDYCNYKKKGLVETILSDYVDVQDKANDALKGGTQSSVFGKNMSNLDKLFDKYPELKQ